MLFYSVHIIARYADLEVAERLTSRFGRFVQQLTYSVEIFKQQNGLEGFLRNVGHKARGESEDIYDEEDYWHDEEDAEGHGDGGDEEHDKEDDEGYDERHDERHDEEYDEEDDQGHDEGHGGEEDKSMTMCRHLNVLVLVRMGVCRVVL